VDGKEETEGQPKTPKPDAAKEANSQRERMTAAREALENHALTLAALAKR
jgi:hypothetical protein